MASVWERPWDEYDGRRWVTVQRPHNPYRSFDYATCLCGWQSSSDDYDELQTEVDAHKEAFREEMLTVHERQFGG